MQEVEQKMKAKNVRVPRSDVNLGAGDIVNIQVTSESQLIAYIRGKNYIASFGVLIFFSAAHGCMGEINVGKIN